jgi:flavin reductase (DIM6/NTAB) family NADH-FMN oxidoreductase RutF
MFYEPRLGNHGLKYNPFKSITVPRPIGWISTLTLAGGTNLAPFSQFQNLGFDPPYVMFAADGHADSPRNAQDMGEFVVNMATYALREQMNITAQKVPPGVNEAELAGLEMVPSRLVKPPRVAASPVQMECRYYTTLVLPGREPGATSSVVVGEVVGIHIKDEFIGADGKIDVLKMRPLARMGYMDYTSVTEVFTMPPHGAGAGTLSLGLEGRPTRER